MGRSIKCLSFGAFVGAITYPFIPYILPPTESANAHLYAIAYAGIVAYKSWVEETKEERLRVVASMVTTQMAPDSPSEFMSALNHTINSARLSGIATYIPDIVHFVFSSSEAGFIIGLQAVNPSIEILEAITTACRAAHIYHSRVSFENTAILSNEAIYEGGAAAALAAFADVLIQGTQLNQPEDLQTLAIHVAKLVFEESLTLTDNDYTSSFTAARIAAREIYTHPESLSEAII
jgi:hypothetical protein